MESLSQHWNQSWVFSFFEATCIGISVLQAVYTEYVALVRQSIQLAQNSAEITLYLHSLHERQHYC